MPLQPNRRAKSLPAGRQVDESVEGNFMEKLYPHPPGVTMRLSFPVLLLAIVAAAPAFAQEPDVLDSGAIAEVCKVKFPGDPEAIKACEVSIRVIIDHRVDERIARLEMLVEYLMETNYGLDHRVAELEARIAELESPSPKNEPSIESAPASPTLDCENVRVYLSIEARRACREARDAPVPK